MGVGAGQGEVARAEVLGKLVPDADEVRVPGGVVRWGDDARADGDARGRRGLARACDLGGAMQLTNIARDLGEDVREGRLYLPRDLMEDEGLDEAVFLANPQMSPALHRVIARLLRGQRPLCPVRGESGDAASERSAGHFRGAVYHIHAGIGRQLRRLEHDSIAHRARTTSTQKLGWLMLASLRAAGTVMMPRSAVLHARPLPKVAFLVEAAAENPAPGRDQSDALCSTTATLKARDPDDPTLPVSGRRARSRS